jgi:hypothetical protein
MKVLIEKRFQAYVAKKRKKFMRIIFFPKINDGSTQNE